MPFRISQAGATDVGLQRSHNEDAILIDAERGVFGICDGMGGHASGAVASQLAIATIAEVLARGPANDQELLVGAILAANQVVYERSAADPECHGMGTTVVGIRFDGDRLHVCHVGDSRIYLLRGGQLFQITRDHSLINLYADHPDLVGKLGPAHSNIIVRAIGLREIVEVEHSVLPLEDGDLFLLCSDGLVDMAEDWMVREILTTGESLEDTVATLIRAANNHGGADNVSVILARAERV
jgi:serine/threonine protein phosphatase PrpC